MKYAFLAALLAVTVSVHGVESRLLENASLQGMSLLCIGRFLSVQARANNGPPILVSTITRPSRQTPDGNAIRPRG